MNLTIKNICETGVDITAVQGIQVSIKAGNTGTIQVDSINPVTVMYDENGIPNQSVTKTLNTSQQLTLFRMGGSGGKISLG